MNFSTCLPSRLYKYLGSGRFSWNQFLYESVYQEGRGEGVQGIKLPNI